MYRFHIPSMTCGGCVAAITRVITQLDVNAQISADLGQHSITVIANIPAEAISDQLKASGYIAQPVELNNE